MCAKPVINYSLKDGKAENEDGSFKATVSNCSHTSISVTSPGGERLRHALEFTGPQSVVKIPATGPLANTEVFSVEMVIRPKGTAGNRMNLMEGQLIPFAFSLSKIGTSWHLTAAVHTKKGWIGVTDEQSAIPLNSWTPVSMVFTGDDLVLFARQKVVARRTISAADLVPVGTKAYYIGTWVDGHRDQYVGSMAGLRFWDAIEPSLLTLVTNAEHSGVGEIDSKYAELGGAAGFLREPTVPERRIGKGRYRIYQGGRIYWSADTGAHEVHGLILEHYLRKGGPKGMLGFPRGDEVDGGKPDSKVSCFEKGHIYWSSATGAREVHGSILVHFLRLGGDKGFLGLPLSDELAVYGGQRNDFEGGTIYWSPSTGAHEVHGPIYERYRKLRATKGFLGFPISDESIIYDENQQPTGGRLSRFTGGTIYWSEPTGAYEAHGDIRKAYEAMGGPLSILGYPITNETASSGSDVRYNDFEHGIIVWRPGMDAWAITELRLHVGMVKSSKIDDGWSDDAELITYITLRVDGRYVEKKVRRPTGHGGTSRDIDYNHTITPVRHNTDFFLKIQADDWDEVSSNDWLGSLEQTFDIRSIWGLTGGSPPGIYVDQPSTIKGGDAPKLSTIKYNFSIQAPHPLDPKKHFREQYWWSFDNFKTSTLSRQQFADTFRDAGIVENWWDKLCNPFDWLFYETAYKGLAKKGNCFGMCLEALNCRTSRSLFVEPLHEYKAYGDKCLVKESDVPAAIRKAINHVHGYQLGASAVRWYMSRLTSLDAIHPLHVYDRVKHFLDIGDYPVVSMFDLEDFRGHAVLPYECKPGAASDPHRIYVADPNVPWCSRAGDPTYIEIRKDDTFRFVGGTSSYQSKKIVGGLLPGAFLLDIPFHRLSSIPRTPFWEIFIGLAELLGGIFLIAGDAQTNQLTGDDRVFYKTVNGKKRVIHNGIPGLARIPFLNCQDAVPELYAQQNRVPSNLEMDIRGLRNGQYDMFFRTASNVVSLNSPIESNAKDKIDVLEARTSWPVFELSSSQALKTVKVDYGVISDTHGRDFRGFTTELQVARDAKAAFSVARRGAGLEIAQGGPIKPFEVTMVSKVGNQIKRSTLTCTPVTVGEVIRFSPRDWALSTDEVVVEHLSAIDGSVLKRAVEHGTLRGP